MSDVLEVGGIEAKLTVDTTQFESGMERSGEQMKGLYTRINTLPPAIQKLQQREEEFTRKMEEQRKKIAEMDAALTAAADQYSALEKAMGRTGDIDLDKVFARETAELKKADAQLDEYRRKLEQVDAQKQEAMEKYNASAAKSAETQGYKDSSLAIDSVANSLRALSPVLGDSVSGVGNLAERMVYLKQSLSAAASGAASTGAIIGSAISGGIGIAVSAVGMLISAWQEAEAEREQAMEAAQQWLADHDEQVQQLTQSMHVLDDQLSSLDDVISARETLADLFPNMVLGYNSEGEAILANSQALEQQIDLMNERARLTRQQLLQDDDGEALIDYDNERKKIEDLQEQVKAAQKEVDVFQEIYNESGGSTLARDLEARQETLKKLTAELTDSQLTYMDTTANAQRMLSLQIEDAIGGFESLDTVQKVVARDMISGATDELLAITDKTDRLSEQRQVIEDIRSVLSDDKAVTDRYNVIIGVSTTGQAQLEAEQRERVATLYDSLVDKYKAEAEKDYKDETATIKDELNQQYNNQKATLEAEYEATRDSLQARQKAYQSLTFNVTSLDEQALANKMDLLDRQAAAEEDAQVRAIQAVQRRYYEEARLIIETANAEIQAYNDRLAALDEADRQAEEARKARQNQNKLRDLNESYAKQQAENEREMQEALEAYEEQRAVLEEAIAHPASLTHEKLARQQLAELEKKWAEEREGLERDHADKLLTIQRQLDEEKLSQQEEAEADQRQAERESLNEQIKDLESNAQQQLAALNNQYSVEKEIQAKAISDQLEAAQKGYQDQLEALNNWKEETLSAELDAAEKRRDAAITEEKLTAKAIEDLEKLSYDERLRLLDEYGVSAEEKAKAINEKIWAAFNEGKSQQTTGPLTYEDTIKQMAPWVLDPSLLPGYASGGIVSSPTLAWVGEGSEPEAIMPLSRVADIVNAALEGRTRANQELMQRAYEAMLPYRAITSGGLIQNNNQRTSETNIHIDTVEINNANQLRAAITQLTSVGGGA